MTGTLPTQTSNIAAIAGPAFLTCVLNSMLMGILSVHVFLYYLAFPDDAWSTKAVAYTVFSIELAQVVIIIHSAFDMFAYNFSNIYIFDEIRALWLVPPLTAFVTLFVQCFYASRIRILSRSLRIPIVIVALSVIQLIGGLIVGHFGRKKGRYSLLNTDVELLADVGNGMWSIGSTICDLIIAVYMIYSLSKFDTRMKRTKVHIRKIIRLTIETGALTTTIAIITFALGLIPGDPMYYEVPMGITGKVYAISMMVLINSRAEFRVVETTVHTVEGGTRMSAMQFSARQQTQHDSISGSPGDVTLSLNLGEHSDPDSMDNRLPTGLDQREKKGVHVLVECSTV